MITQLLLLTFTITVDSKTCHMAAKNIFCSDTTLPTISNHIIVELDNNDVTDLHIQDSYLNLIEAKSFANYGNLKNLAVVNSQIMFLEHDAFQEHHHLEHLDLSGNFLKRFNTKMLPRNNNLQTLNLSNNIIAELNHFDVTDYPDLTILDISNNLIEYLPISLLYRIKQDKDFQFIGHNNPYHCSLPKWKQALDDELKKKFCLKARTGNFQKLKLQPLLSPVTTNDTLSKKINCIRNCHFVQCFIWTITGIWVGIIIGNICKIKDLLFIRPKRLEEKFTQYDKLKFRGPTRHNVREQVIVEEANENEEDIQQAAHDRPPGEPSALEERPTPYGIRYIYR